jgi:phage terminase large subunit
MPTENQTRHKVAKCLWCGGAFVKVFGYQWLCENEACAERQISHAVRREDYPEGESPYLFLPLPFQVDIEDHPAKRLLVHGAAGVSKSYFGRWYAYKRCRQIPGFRVLLLRNTYDQLLKNHLQYIPDESAMLGFKWTGLSGANARQCQFKHDGKPDAIMFMGYCQDEGDIAQFVGPEYDLILLEEGVTLIPKAIREISARDRGAATSRPYREPLGIKGQTRILTNPGGRAMNYLHDFFIAKKPDPLEYSHYNPEQYANVTGSITDNPYLDDDYRETTLGHLDDARYEQLASGRWDVFEGQFFTEFNPAVHVTTMEAS